MGLDRAFEWLSAQIAKIVPRSVMESRYTKYFGRFVVVLLVALGISRLAPTLAEQGSMPPPVVTTSGSVIDTSTVTPSPSASTASPTPSPSDSATPAPIYISSTPTVVSESETVASASPNPTAAPKVLADQNLVIHIPSIVPVDPRATSVFLPPFYISGTAYVETCISSDNSFFDVGSKNLIDGSGAHPIDIAGDLTSTLLLTNSPVAVSQLIGSQGGLKVFTAGESVAGTLLRVATVALSKPSLDPTFCSYAAPQNVKIVTITGLHLSLDLKKASIALH